MNCRHISVCEFTKIFRRVQIPTPHTTPYISHHPLRSYCIREHFTQQATCSSARTSVAIRKTFRSQRRIFLGKEAARKIAKLGCITILSSVMQFCWLMKQTGNGCVTSVTPIPSLLSRSFLLSPDFISF
jgi:hypothetical protein